VKSPGALIFFCVDIERGNSTAVMFDSRSGRSLGVGFPLRVILSRLFIGWNGQRFPSRKKVKA
jgi:hypothetical protein